MIDRKLNAPLMIPIFGKYKDMCTIVVVKIESGLVRKNDTLLTMPNKTEVEVAAIYNEMDDEINQGLCGDNMRIRLRGDDDEDLSPGFVLTNFKPCMPCPSLRHSLRSWSTRTSAAHRYTLAEECTLS